MLVEFIGGPMDGEKRQMSHVPILYFVLQPPSPYDWKSVVHTYVLGHNHRYWYEGEKLG